MVVTVGSRKTYIPCMHASCHAKSCKEHESPLHAEAACCAGGEAEGYKCPVVGRVHLTTGRCRFDRISIISRAPLTKANGAKDVLHMITIQDGIKALSEAI